MLWATSVLVTRPAMWMLGAKMLPVRVIFRYDTVAGHLFDEIATHHHARVGQPVAAVVVGCPDHGIALAALDVAVLNGESLEARGYHVATILDEDGRAASLLLDERTVDVVHVDGVDHDVGRDAVVAALHLQSRAARQSLAARVDNLQTSQGDVAGVQHAHRPHRRIAAHDDGTLPAAVTADEHRLSLRALGADVEFAAERLAAMQQQLVTCLQDLLAGTSHRAPCLLWRRAISLVVALVGIHVIGLRFGLKRPRRVA